MLERAYRSVLLTYSDATDDDALAVATQAVREGRGCLHVVVPVPPLSRFSDLGYARAIGQREALDAAATDAARSVVARLPADVAVHARCLPVARVPALMAAIDAHAYDLCVARGSRWPGFYGTRLGVATVRRARKAGLPAILVREPRRRPATTAARETPAAPHPSMRATT